MLISTLEYQKCFVINTMINFSKFLSWTQSSNKKMVSFEKSKIPLGLLISLAKEFRNRILRKLEDNFIEVRGKNNTRAGKLQVFTVIQRRETQDGQWKIVPLWVSNLGNTAALVSCNKARQ